MDATLPPNPPEEASTAAAPMPAPTLDISIIDAPDETVSGALQALIEVMAFAKPQAYGRAQRISGVVRELATASGIEGRWEADMAGALAQLATLGLPTSLLDKLDRGAPLSSDERLTMSRVPAMSAKLLAKIPGTEGLRRAIAAFGAPAANATDSGADDLLRLLPHFIRVAVDFDQLVRGRVPVVTAIRQLRERGVYRVAVLDALEHAYLSDVCGDTAPQELSLDELEPGMTLADDVITTEDVLLVTRGATVTDSMIRRLANYTDRGECNGYVLVHAQPSGLV